MSRVVVREVQPSNLHGFRAGELMLRDLSEGLNAVYAPNASGKSTLAKAIGLLLNPAEFDRRASVDGLVVVDGHAQLRQTRRGDEKINGFPGRAEEYRLDLVELLKGFAKDDSVLVGLIGKGLSTFSQPTARTGFQAVREANQALTELNAARRRKEATLSIEENLPERMCAVQEAEAARSSLLALEGLLDHHSRSTSFKAREAVLQSLLEQAPGIGEQSPDAVSVADTLSEVLSEVRDAHERQLSRLRNIRPDGAIAAKALNAEDRNTVQQALAELEQLQGALTAHRQGVANAKANAHTFREALLRLLPGEAPDDLPIPDATDFARLRNYASEADRQRAAERQALTFAHTLDRWNKEHPDSSWNPEELSQKLIGWLRTEPVVPRDWRPLLMLGIGVIASLAAALLPDLPFRIASAVVGSIALGLIGFLLTPKEPSRPALYGLPQDLQPEYETEALVAEMVLKVQRQRAYAEVRKQLETLAEQPAPETDLNTIAESLRLKCDDPTLLAPVAAALQSYHGALATLAMAEATQFNDEGRIAELCSLLGRTFETYDFPRQRGSEPAAVTAFLDWFEASAGLQMAEAKLERTAAELDAHLDRNGVPESDDLTERLEILKRREPEAQQISELRQETRALSEAIKMHHVDLDPLQRLLNTEDPLAVPVAELERLRAVQCELAGELEQRRADLEKDRQEVHYAERSATVGEKERIYRSAFGKVELKWQETVQLDVAYRLLMAVREKVRREAAPKVVVRANDYLRRFAGGRYQLELGIASRQDELGTLSVVDVHDQRTHSFGELSTGTKAHTMIALKVAILAEQEDKANGGTLKFPLIADEAMAVSDPESSLAIAEALTEIAGERQVIVFTNQPADLALLRKLSPGLNEVSLTAQIPMVDVNEPPKRQLRPAKSYQFDPRLHIGGHALGAVFPPGISHSLEGHHRLDQVELPKVLKDLSERLEEIRQELVRDHPRLQWAAIEGQGWASGKGAPEIERLLEDVYGCPHRFKIGLSGLSGRTMNQNLRDRAVTWLEDNSYLAAPPTRDKLYCMVRDRLGPNPDLFHVDHATRLFEAAFIPVEGE